MAAWDTLAYDGALAYGGVEATLVGQAVPAGPRRRAGSAGKVAAWDTLAYDGALAYGGWRPQW